MRNSTSTSQSWVVPKVEGVVFATLVTLTASWETVSHLVERVFQRQGNPEYSAHLTVVLIVVIQTLAIAKTRRRQLDLGNFSAIALGALLVLGLVSTFWSYIPTYATFEWALLATSVLSFVGVASRYGPQTLLFGHVLGCEIMVVAAFLSNEFDFADGGYFVYPGKLSPIVQIVLCVLVGWLVTAKFDSLRHRVKVLIVLALLVANFAVLLHIENRTSHFSSLLTLGLGVLALLCRSAEKATASTQLTPRLLRLGAPLILLTAFLMMKFTPSSVFGHTLDTTFTGRTTLWKATWEGILDRPIFGWGWLSGWWDPAYRDSVLPEVGGRAPRFYWGHSVWLDLGLSVGFIGIVLAFAAIATSITSSLPQRKFNFSVVTSTLLITTLTVHLMFTSLHREAQLPFTVVLLGILIRHDFFRPSINDETLE